MKKAIFLSIFIALVSLNNSFGQGSTYCGPYKQTAPIIRDGIKRPSIIIGYQITNPTGHCISLSNCSNITIQNCKLGPSKKEAVYLYRCSNIKVINCSMNAVETGVYAVECSGIKVLRNDVKNVQGPKPRGQMVQFNNVSGSGNRINYNVGENIAGQSNPEDEINLYMSNGSENDPIQVIANWIRGGGPSSSGGGIMTGDNGGSYIHVENNILVDPGQYGISISSGHHITIANNKIYGKQQSFTNIGLFVWNQYSTDCSSNTVINNQVNFTNKKGESNPMWNSGNCGEVTGWKTNSFNPNLNSSILPTKIIGRCINDSMKITKP